MPDVRVPALLRAAARDDSDAARWLRGLSARLAEVARRWGLELGTPYEPGGMTAWVAPATTADGAGVVVKVARRHVESEDEAAGLRAWDGNGAVRLLDAGQLDDTTDVLLLEPCEPGTPATQLPPDEVDVVIADILRRLWIEPPPTFRPLSQMCAYWLDALDPDDAARRIGDAGIVRAGCDQFASLADESVRDPVLLATDLHAGNVLRADREPWLAVDPKPYVGDRTFDALQHLLNDERRARDDLDGWLDRLAGLLDLDRDRLRRWLFARCVVEVRWFDHAAELARLLAP